MQCQKVTLQGCSQLSLALLPLACHKGVQAPPTCHNLLLRWECIQWHHVLGHIYPNSKGTAWQYVHCNYRCHSTLSNSIRWLSRRDLHSAVHCNISESIYLSAGKLSQLYTQAVNNQTQHCVHSSMHAHTHFNRPEMIASSFASPP